MSRFAAQSDAAAECADGPVAKRTAAAVWAFAHQAVSPSDGGGSPPPPPPLENVAVFCASHLRDLERLIDPDPRIVLHPIQPLDCTPLPDAPSAFRAFLPSKYDRVNQTLAEHVALALRAQQRGGPAVEDAWLFPDVRGVRVHLVGSAYTVVRGQTLEQTRALRWDDWRGVSARIFAAAGRELHACHCPSCDRSFLPATREASCPQCRQTAVSWARFAFGDLVRLHMPPDGLARIFLLESTRITLCDVDLLRDELLMCRRDAPSLPADVRRIVWSDHCVGLRAPVDTSLAIRCKLDAGSVPELLARVHCGRPGASDGCPEAEAAEGERTRVLRPHQRRILEFFERNPGTGLGRNAAIACVGTGLGKTALSIALGLQMAARVSPKAPPFFVVVGPPALFAHARGEGEGFQRWIDRLVPGGPRLHSVADGGGLPVTTAARCAGVFIDSNRLLSERERRADMEVVDECRRALEGKRVMVLVVDEAHNYRNQRDGFLAVKRVASATGDASCRIALTATPVFTARAKGELSNFSSLVQIVTSRREERCVETYEALAQFSDEDDAPYVPIAWSMTKTKTFPQQVYRSHTVRVDESTYLAHTADAVRWGDELALLTGEAERRAVVDCVLRLTAKNAFLHRACEPFLAASTPGERMEWLRRSLSDDEVADRTFDRWLPDLRNCIVDAVMGLATTTPSERLAAIPFYHRNFRMQFAAPETPVGDSELTRSLRACRLYDPAIMRHAKVVDLLRACAPPIRVGLLLLWTAIQRGRLPIVFHGEYLDSCTNAFYDAVTTMVAALDEQTGPADHRVACALVTGETTMCGATVLSAGGSATSAAARARLLARFQHGLVDVLCFSGVFGEAVNVVSNASFDAVFEFARREIVAARRGSGGGALTVVLRSEGFGRVAYAFEWPEGGRTCATWFKPLRTLLVGSDDEFEYVPANGTLRVVKDGPERAWNAFLRIGGSSSSTGKGAAAADAPPEARRPLRKSDLFATVGAPAWFKWRFEEGSRADVEKKLDRFVVQNVVAPVQQFCHLHATWNVTTAEQAEGRVVRTDSHPRSYGKGARFYAHGSVEIHQIVTIRAEGGDVPTGDEMRRQIAARHSHDIRAMENELAQNRNRDGTSDALDEYCAPMRHADGGIVGRTHPWRVERI